MYRPKSPTANKPMNFSPCPNTRRKPAYTKTIPDQQAQAQKQKPPTSQQQDKQDKKPSPIPRKSFIKNLQLDTINLMDGVKIVHNNQTPKFCMRVDEIKQMVTCPRSNPVGVSNFFSFGEKCQEKVVKTQRKMKETYQKQYKQLSRSPKEMKKKTINQTIAAVKTKPDIGIFETSLRHKKNQSYLR